jgi:hypothetical protein
MQSVAFAFSLYQYTPKKTTFEVLQEEQGLVEVLEMEE